MVITRHNVIIMIVGSEWEAPASIKINNDRECNVGQEGTGNECTVTVQ